MGGRDPLTPEGVEIYKSFANRTGAGTFNAHDILQLVASVEDRERKAKELEARLTKVRTALINCCAHENTLFAPHYNKIKDSDPKTWERNSCLAIKEFAKKDPQFKAVYDAFIEAAGVLREEREIPKPA